MRAVSGAGTGVPGVGTRSGSGESGMEIAACCFGLRPKHELVIRPGEGATLLWEERGIRLEIPVVCLDGGAKGETVRARVRGHGGRMFANSDGFGKAASYLVSAGEGESMRRNMLVLFLLGLLCVPPGAEARDKAKKSAGSHGLAEYLQRVSASAASIAATTPGSLWRDNGRLANLVADYKASRVGDLVTISVAQNLSASSTGNVSSNRVFSANSGITALPGHLKTSGVADLFSANSTQVLGGKAQATSQTSLSTMLTGRVAAVLATGTLVVEAERQITMNNQHETVILRGLVRPGDLDATNTVPSNHVGNLEVEVKGKGVISDGTRPPNLIVRWILRIVGFRGPRGSSSLRVAGQLRRLWLRGCRCCRRIMKGFGCKALQLATMAALAVIGAGGDEAHKVLIRDVATVEGVRENSLVGYGLVAGLKGTGTTQQTYFTVQTLASVLARMGVQIPAAVLQSTVQVKNVAAVFVTASLPPFSRPGMRLDVMVSSIGDARQGGGERADRNGGPGQRRESWARSRSCTAIFPLTSPPRMGYHSPLHFDKRQTDVVPQTTVSATEAPARNVELNEGASVEELVTRLQAIGATARDVVSILQAIKAAGALEAELEVI